MDAILMKDGQSIPLTRISDLLCGALEGGSNYWYRIDKFIQPPEVRFCIDPRQQYRHLDYPLNEGGALIIVDPPSYETSKAGKRLDLLSIQAGLEIMKMEFGVHWTNFMDENDDAITSDVFLQCCIFGKLIYG